MAPRDYTKAEMDRLAGAYYTALHLHDCSTPWEDLPDWHRAKHRRGVRALLGEVEVITDEQMAAWRAERARSRRLA